MVVLEASTASAEASTASAVTEQDCGPDPSERRVKPRPTFTRGTGRHTNLAFPTPGKRATKEGRWCEGLSL